MMQDATEYLENAVKLGSVATKVMLKLLIFLSRFCSLVYPPPPSKKKQKKKKTHTPSFLLTFPFSPPNSLSSFLINPCPVMQDATEYLENAVKLGIVATQVMLKLLILLSHFCYMICPPPQNTHTHTLFSPHFSLSPT